MDEKKWFFVVKEIVKTNVIIIIIGLALVMLRVHTIILWATIAAILIVRMRKAEKEFLEA